jgi:hypothetical protein
LKNNNLDLYTAHTHVHNDISRLSVSCREPGQALSLQYWRSGTQAEVVERMMGRDIYSREDIEVNRHPVIEMRIAPDHFALELILTPDARIDQQNLAGKLKVERHRRTFFQLLQRLGGDYRMGFWQGIELGEMHLQADQFRWIQVLDEWISTFSPGTDYFRVGVWYDPDDEVLSDERIVPELVEHFKTLHSLYVYLLWTSDNNFRSFYQNQGATRR